jgi:hypothetical protein
MNTRGERSTRKGRVVYNRRPHIFSQRDAARVVRHALNFPPYQPATGLEQYADYTYRTFLEFSFRFNFLPMYRMFYQDWEKDPDTVLAEKIGSYVAASLGLGGEFYDKIVLGVRDLIFGSPYHAVMKLKPEFASIITSIAYATGTIYEEEIYGRKGRR